MEQKALAVFEGKSIRRVWHDDEWWFSVIDIVAILTGSTDPKQYIKKMHQRDPVLGANWGTICTLLELMAPDGKKRETNCVNTEGAFRIIQSIPSLKAEPFKLWLAKTGYERVQEIQNPELAQTRMKELYRQKGYSDSWIEKRVRGIAIRDELTDEWKNRDVGAEREYAILTAEISKATFGMTPGEYKQFKGLEKPNQNLRDHMNDLELIFTMLGEASTTRIAQDKDAQGFMQNQDAAQEGGTVAGVARRELERRSVQKVSTPDNYLDEPEKKKKLEQKSSSKLIETP